VQRGKGAESRRGRAREVRGSQRIAGPGLRKAQRQELGTGKRGARKLTGPKQPVRGGNGKGAGVNLLGRVLKLPVAGEDSERSRCGSCGASEGCDFQVCPERVD
jgi:hypothetical protein